MYALQSVNVPSEACLINSPGALNASLASRYALQRAAAPQSLLLLLVLVGANPYEMLVCGLGQCFIQRGT